MVCALRLEISQKNQRSGTRKAVTVVVTETFGKITSVMNLAVTQVAENTFLCLTLVESKVIQPINIFQILNHLSVSYRFVLKQQSGK